MSLWSICLVILVAVAGVPAYSAGVPLQTSQSAPEAESDSLVVPPPGPHRHSIVIDGTFNSDDSSVGGTYRFYALPELEIAVFVSFSGRFWDEVVRVPFRPNVQLQVRETRFLWSFGLHKAASVNRWLGGFLDAGAGYTSANYDGVSLDPEEGWTPLLRVGATFRYQPSFVTGTLVRWEIGYRYADLRSVPTNWLYVGLGFLH